MKEQCKHCDRKQIDKVCQFAHIQGAVKDELTARAEEYLANVDMSKCNPEVMADVWELIAEVTGDRDPYREVKRYYDLEVQRLAPDIRRIIENGGDRLGTALKIAICGNLIDFAADRAFDIAELTAMLSRLGELAIDDSTELFRAAGRAKTLLYLGDNCGEIALDKLLLAELKRANPDLKLYYGVRGKPIVNDVTVGDAALINMDEVAEVISNGDGSLGTVLKRTSPAFKALFESADLVICKGQGNYESLLGEDKAELYFLFMAKCAVVADPLGVAPMSIVCMKNKRI